MDIGGKFFMLKDEFLAELPISIPTSLPFGEVLLGDRLATEVGSEHGFDLGDLIKTTSDGNGGLAGIEGAVDLVAESAREFGDLAVAFVVGV